MNKDGILVGLVVRARVLDMDESTHPSYSEDEVLADRMVEGSRASILGACAWTMVWTK